MLGNLREMFFQDWVKHLIPSFDFGGNHDQTSIILIYALWNTSFGVKGTDMETGNTSGKTDV